MAFSPDGKRLAACGWYGVVAAWDVETGKELYRKDAHDFWADCLAFSPDREGTFLATAGRDRSIKIWDGRTGEDQRTLWGHDRDVKTLAFHPGDPTVLVSGSEDQTLRIWDVVAPARSGTFCAATRRP